MINRWTIESWGESYPPENANEIISAANDLIDTYAETHDVESVELFVEKMWEEYCRTNTLPGLDVSTTH